jgi:hypothetical protein
MTEQQAEVLAARLTRIWGVSKQGIILLNQGHFYFDGWIGEETFLRVRVEGRHSSCTFSGVDAHYRLDFNQTDFISQPDHQDYPRWIEGQREFAAKHLAFFRRSCWLSGCAIEATATEKAQWLQGFTREEVES